MTVQIMSPSEALEALLLAETKLKAVERVLEQWRPRANCDIELEHFVEDLEVALRGEA